MAVCRNFVRRRCQRLVVNSVFGYDVDRRHKPSCGARVCFKDRKSSMEFTPKASPRIFVAVKPQGCLEDPLGSWIDATQTAERMLQQINEMLNASNTSQQGGESATEWFINDSEGFGVFRIKEDADLEGVGLIASTIADRGQSYAVWLKQALDEFDPCLVDGIEWVNTSLDKDDSPCNPHERVDQEHTLGHEARMSGKILKKA